jgi:malate dehydrogenase
MGGALDSSRFRTYLQWRWINQQTIFLLWLLVGMDTTMIPLTRLASYNGIPVSQFFLSEALQKLLLILW